MVSTGCQLRNYIQMIFLIRGDIAHRTLSLQFIEFVQLPLNNIVFDVCGNIVQFILVANNMVMKTCLPCKCNIVGVGVMGDACLQTTYNRS